MADIKITPAFLNGEVTVCSSKSIAHRAVILGALSEKDITIKNVDYSLDLAATIDGIRALGVDIEFKDKNVFIKKSNIKRNLNASFNAKESGSTLRFLIPVFIALGNECEFFGEGRLPKRPLDDYFSIFEKEEIAYEKGENYLPLRTKGTFGSNEFFVKGNVSSQFITGLMLMSAVYDREITINITTALESKPYIDITKKVLEDFGHEVSFSDNKIIVKKGNVTIDEYTVENDWSQGAFFLAGGAINGEVTLCDMNYSSKQGDKQIVDILKKMGANITVGSDYIKVLKSQLKGIQIDVLDIPDLVPVLAVLGACATGETLLYNAKRLRLKESDRIFSVSEMLKSAGVKTKSGEDYLKIYGNSEFLNCEVDSFNDHRIVMSSAVLGLKTNELVIKNCDAVKKSYPDFFKDYFEIGGKGEFLNE